MGRKVTVIPPTISLQTHLPTTQKVKRKVAGYARVSTDFEEQLTSYEAQVDYYTKYIQEREDWEFVKVYTDEGISATSTVHRDGFNQMVADALDGKIDLIVTKSVSRFARNTVDSLTTVRKLKEKGVDSYEDLVALTDKLTSRFSELSDSIKAAEKRMVEIGALQTHINNYSKTRKTYEAYRKSGYSKKFFEDHRDELMLHKAAKQAFDQLDGQKVPSRQALHEEFNRLLVEKKQAYAEYRQVKKEMQEYLIAKQTVEHILGIERHKRVEEKKQQKEEQR